MWGFCLSFVEGFRLKDKDSDFLEEKAESTEDIFESFLSLLVEGSLDFEELRLSFFGFSRV